MRFSTWMICGLLLAGRAGFCPGGRAEEISSITAGVPVREQYSWPFARVPMAEAPRSIAIPLATNLQLAFDTKSLRTHTVWLGGKPILSGYAYDRGASALCAINGAPLWTMPAGCPWQSGERSTNTLAELPRGFGFRGVSTQSGAVRLLYDVADGAGRATRIQESPRVQALEKGAAIVRRFEIAPGDQMLWFLAHAEIGKSMRVSTNSETFKIQRENNCLVVSARGANATLFADAGTTNQVRLWVQIPPHREAVALEVASAVCASSDAISSIAFSNPLAPADLNFPTNNFKNPAAKPALTFQGVAVPGRVDGDEFYRREQIPVPKEFELLVSGMDWLPNGDLAISTWPGEVYVARGVTGPATNISWRRFACGLQEPLGLKVVNGQICVAQKCELTRLVDTDGNGEADLHECVSDAWGFNGDLHYFAYGPAVDAKGNFYVTLDGNTGLWKPVWELPFRGWTVKISPDGKSIAGFSSGLRSPNGCFTYGPDQDIFCTDNEGHWIGACKLNHCRAGKFFGYPSSTPMPRAVFQNPSGFDAPAVWFPRKLSTSASGGATISDARFGPFTGQMLVGDFGTAAILRVALERVNGDWQGAVWPFARGFLSGVERLTLGPDGQLYVGCLKRGWSSSGPQEFSFERLAYTGKVPFEVREVRARADGFELVFTQPVDLVTATNLENWEVSQFGYKFHATYGSPEIDHSGKENSATSIAVTQATLSADKQRLILKLTGCKPGFVTAVRSKMVKNLQGASLWHDTFYYTLNQIPK